MENYVTRRVNGGSYHIPTLQVTNQEDDDIDSKIYFLVA